MAYQNKTVKMYFQTKNSNKSKYQCKVFPYKNNSNKYDNAIGKHRYVILTTSN